MVRTGREIPSEGFLLSNLLLQAEKSGRSVNHSVGQYRTWSIYTDTNVFEYIPKLQHVPEPTGSNVSNLRTPIEIAGNYGCEKIATNRHLTQPDTHLQMEQWALSWN